jgi:hypothetical protein
MYLNIMYRESLSFLLPQPTSKSDLNEKEDVDSDQIVCDIQIFLMLRALDLQLIRLNATAEIGHILVSYTPDLFIAEFTSINSRGLDNGDGSNNGSGYNNDDNDDNNNNNNDDDNNDNNNNNNNNNTNKNFNNYCNSINNDENIDLYDMKGKRFLDAYLVNNTCTENNTDIHHLNTKKESLKNIFFGFGLKGYNSQGESSDGEFDHSVGTLYMYYV